MPVVLVIGLPTEIRNHVVSSVKKAGSSVSFILASVAKEGGYQLLPKPELALSSLQNYYETIKNKPEDALIIVLDYAPIPQNLYEELSVMESMDVDIVHTSNGNDGWPARPSGKKEKLKDAALNKLNSNIVREILNEEETYSDYFISAAEKNAKLLIINDALELCDDLPFHRKVFLQKSAEAFLEYVNKNGAVGDLRDFFSRYGLDLAQTGGIETELTVNVNGQQKHKASRSTHLKQGDRTDKNSATRIYYQEFCIDEEYYLAVIYVGPHPDKNISRTYNLN